MVLIIPLPKRGSRGAEGPVVWGSGQGAERRWASAVF